MNTIFALGIALSTTLSQTAQDAKTKLFELVDKESVVVDFDAGSSALTSGEAKDVEALVDAARADGVIERVIVAAWADKEYPATKGQELAKSDRELADARAAVVEKALTSRGVKKVESHSMAAQPAWIEKAFNTKDAKVKSDAIRDRLRDKGGPGKVVVIVRRAGDDLAH